MQPMVGFFAISGLFLRCWSIEKRLVAREVRPERMGMTQRIPGSFIDGISPSGMPRTVKLKFAMLSITPELMPFESAMGLISLIWLITKSSIVCLPVFALYSASPFAISVSELIVVSSIASAHLRG